MSETRQAVCTAHGCNLGSVMADMCVFHANIERNLWPAVTEYLNSPEGDTLIAAGRECRMLWALGVETEFAQYSANSAPMNTHEAAFRILRKLQKKGLLPEAVDPSDKPKTLQQLRQAGGTRFFMPDHGCYFSLEWVCETYEASLVEYVRNKAQRG